MKSFKIFLENPKHIAQGRGLVCFFKVTVELFTFNVVFICLHVRRLWPFSLQIEQGINKYYIVCIV